MDLVLSLIMAIQNLTFRMTTIELLYHARNEVAGRIGVIQEVFYNVRILYFRLDDKFNVHLVKKNSVLT